MYINQKLHAQLLDFLEKHSGLTGAKVLNVLLRVPGRPVCVIDIAFSIYRYDLTANELAAIAKNAFNPIPISDKRAQAEYLQRLHKLLAKQARGETRWDEEIIFLKKELRRITKPDGGIKNEYPELKKAYCCFRHGLLRLIDIAARNGQLELADYIAGHIKTGIWCQWMVEG